MSTAQPKWNAEDYAKNSGAQLKWAQELIAKLALRGSESVLDIGCGDGKITAQLALAAKKGKVLGIDLSEDMIRLAVEQFPATAYPNLSFQCMDASNIHLSDKFDVAFSNASLHWVKDHIAMLRGVHACLRPGGRILFQMGGRGNADEVFAAVEKLIEQPQWCRYYEDFELPYHFYRPEEYAVWLAETGFRPVRVELVPKDMQHQGMAGLKGWLRTTWFPYTDSLPVELRDVFLDELAKAYTMARPVDPLGKVHVEMVRLEVEAHAL
ncbi:MAG TPA: methyltransferase domain-containing protein [Verrucomicrobiae bacterium]|nr:methyltransferase domain-containing protein [Verrucomicrobiae bacterium]